MADVPRSVVVDTNVIFSALLKVGGRFAETLLQSGYSFYIGESVLVELFRHKEKILRLSNLEDADLARFYHVLLRRLILFKEDMITPFHWRTASELCSNVDESDIPHVALTLELDGLLWTGDKRLREGLSAKGFDRFFLPSVPEA